jgi:uncharacterized protein (DUF1697 family)
MRYAVLLRGVNVGGNRLVPMAQLRAALERFGYEDVATLLQSGNVVLSSKLSRAKLEQALPKQLAEEFGAPIEIVVRTRKELAEVIARNPFKRLDLDPSRSLVHFLSKPLAAGVARELKALDVEPDQLVISGRELYASHPGGIRDSKLAAVLSRKQLGVVVTARNWNTVTKLLVLADQ